MQKKHKVKVVTPNEYPAFLNWLPGNNKVLVHTINKKEVEKNIAVADIVFCIDFNSLKRIE